MLNNMHLEVIKLTYLYIKYNKSERSVLMNKISDNNLSVSIYIVIFLR